MSRQNNFLVLSALGRDKPGIVDQLTKAVFDLGCNIADSRMTVLGGTFSILLLVEGPWNQLARLEDQVEELGKRLGLTIISERTEPRSTQGDLLPYAVEVVALDNPGIVHRLANFFSAHGINIEDMNTTSYAAAHTGAPMFAVQMTVGIPAGIHIASLRDEFMEFCDGMNLDAVLEPIKG